MRYFVLEVRRENGEDYNPCSTCSLLSGLNHILKGNGAKFSILDKGDPGFRELLLTLDSVTSNLHRQGIGARRKSAPIVSRKHENILWEKGLLGFDDLKALRRAAFFHVGLHFVLRDVEEHHNLQRSKIVSHPADLQVYSGDVYYVYAVFISKNNHHQFKDTNARYKCVKSVCYTG